MRPSDVVVDVGAGYCEFINNIRAGRKIAVDLNPRVREFAQPDVAGHQRELHRARLDADDASADVVFMSNFLEHLPEQADGVRHPGRGAGGCCARVAG